MTFRNEGLTTYMGACSEGAPDHVWANFDTVEAYISLEPVSGDHNMIVIEVARRELQSPQTMVMM